MATPSPQQQQTAAIAAAVKQMVDAATAPIKQAQTTYDAGSQTNQQNVTGLSQALAAILGGIGPGVEKTYADASQRQAAFARGFSDQMQQHLGQNATNTSSFLQNVVGAPTSQIAETAAKVAPAAAGDTLYGLQGFIPASTLNEEGAAYTANAQRLPAIANSQGLQQIAKLQAVQQAQDATFAQQIGSEAGKAPQYQRQIASDLFDQNFKVQTLRDSEARTKFDQALGLAKLKDAESNTSFSQKATAARLSLDAQKAARSALQSDRSYAVSLAQLGIADKKLQLSTLAAEYKLANGGYSPTAVAKFKGKAYTIATDGLNGYDVTTAGVTTHMPGFSYQEAIQHARREGIPLSVAMAQFNQVYGPGVKGRPLTPSAIQQGKFELGGLSQDRPSSLAGGFLPQGARYTQGRADQGRDFQTDPGGAIIAPGDGIVLAVKSDPNGFGPSYPIVHFTSGPYSGQNIYVGHTLSTLQPGQKFNAGDTISRTGAQPIGNAAVPGWAEIGYAQGGTPGAFGQKTPFGG